VPGMAIVFPGEVVKTVLSLAELHSLSESMDTEMALRMPGPEVDAAHYIAAWQAVGRPADRERQIALLLAVGAALDHYTRNILLRHTLRMMRGPARAIGIGELQKFLETGFDTFREMRGAGEFLATIAKRERELAAALFAADPLAPAVDPASPLGQLP